MTIGTSLGNHYQDEHHYQARSFTPFPGFHQSENIEDRRKEFFDPRTDPQGSGYDLEPGAWRSEDLDITGQELPTAIGMQLGAADLDAARAKQISNIRAQAYDRFKKQMEEDLELQEAQLGIPEDSGPWGTPDLPLPRKTDQQIRDENNALH